MTRYRASCDDCGWAGTYRSDAMAQHATRLHSCERWRRRAAAAARHAERMARIDRTPKPCPHKRTTHQHGTYAAYTLDGCRCRPCVDDAVAYERRRLQQTAYGRWQPYVDAAPVRAHVQALADAGLGHKRIRALAGVSQGAIGKLMYGERKPDGTLRPSARVRRETADKLLAVTFDPAHLGASVCIDGTGTRRRLQALVALGWSQSKLATRMGMGLSNFTRTIGSDRVQAATARRAAALYDDLSESPPPQTCHRERQSAARARNHAHAKGWLPPIWWDDDTIDDPTQRPSVEAPTRDLPGRPPTRDHLVEDATFLAAHGLSLDEIAGRLGLKPHSVKTAFRRAGAELPPGLRGAA